MAIATTRRCRLGRLMASHIPCAYNRCETGIGIFACQGCERVFCKKHSFEHRQELAKELDKVVKEHDVILTQLQSFETTIDVTSHALLDQIDKWEQHAKKMTQKAVDEARSKVLQSLSDNNHQLTKECRLLIEDIRPSWESEDYVETDLKKWRRQLDKIKDEFSMPKNIRIENDLLSLKHMLNVISTPRIPPTPRPYAVQSRSTKECFEKYCGFIRVEESGKLVIHTGNSDMDASVYGAKLYTHGTHRIPVKIDKMQDNYWIFIGIVSSSFPANVNASAIKSAYGWAASKKACPFVYLQGIEMNGSHYAYNGDICKNDIIELILNCTERKIQLVNKRTNNRYEINVNIKQCPFPWKIAVTLYYSGDRVRLV
ncbi:unnamed protein product [Didymodactylos carnosus]|uniref:B box-type domain-containing protein n=1 Tax=Didymodactylos carnosus TaxID=1234261 RepID=A0A816A395_9BILA|nr:unnamed protein product [Didymodactylos carnosus]CAF1590758.1 unnamed protein product [Didymodactylos carnosus]CAF3664646.1 unnamed protein product [Didymodactylos carnosus]CAF4462632.1 unnamed protein product [Didymodactylos carnosus]